MAKLKPFILTFDNPSYFPRMGSISGIKSGQTIGFGTKKNPEFKENFKTDSIVVKMTPHSGFYPSIIITATDANGDKVSKNLQPQIYIEPTDKSNHSKGLIISIELTIGENIGFDFEIRPKTKVVITLNPSKDKPTMSCIESVAKLIRFERTTKIK